MPNSKKPQKEQELAEQKNLLTRIVENLPVALFCKDAKDDFRFAMWNQKAEQILGLTKEEVLGKSDSDFFSKEQTEFFREKDRQAMKDGKVIDIAEEPINSKNHGQRWLHTIKVPIYDSKGEPQYLFGISEDITERRLVQQELIRTKAEALQASEAKSEFLANMSHEIRTPLNAIIGMGELLQDTKLTEDQAKYVQTIVAAGDSLLSLVNDILDLSKIEARQMELRERDFDLTDLLDKVAALMAGRADQKGLRFKAHLASGVPRFVRGDADRLRQVLLNLVGNAIKFTEKGEISLTVQSPAGAADEGMLQFVVTDTGTGIRPESREIVFDRFTQADSSITRKFGGTGLGLNISRQLVELMGGRIWLESAEGKGSTFTFTIKIGSPLASPIQADKRDLPELKPGRILLVDDSQDNRALVKSFLENTPLEIEMAEDGEQAVRKFKSQTFELVLMDVQMPVMDGYSATREIRNWEKQNSRQPTPILAFTARTLNEEGKKSAEAGCSGLLTKPIKRADLFRAISQAAATEVAPVEISPDAEAKSKLRSLIPAYLEARRADLAAMEMALKKNDFPTIERLAHKMRGSAGGYGFDRLSDIGASLESASTQKATADIRAILGEMRNYLTYVVGADLPEAA